MRHGTWRAGLCVCGKDEPAKQSLHVCEHISNLRKDVYGSDKEYSFCYIQPKNWQPCGESFEAPIDASPMPRCRELEAGNGRLPAVSYGMPWRWDVFLSATRKSGRVNFHMDNDLGGLKNARRIQAMLHEYQRFKHIRVGDQPAPHRQGL